MIRSCAHNILDDGCVTVNYAPVSEFDDVRNATGVICYCHGELCNGPGSLSGSAPQPHGGRMAMSFTVISLLALAAARFLGQ